MALLALVTLFARALVPVGFMPNAEAARQGKLELAFCSPGGGVQTLLVDAFGEPGQDESPGALQECPFSLLASPGLMPAPAAAVFVRLLVVGRAALLPASDAGLPPLPSTGPPLGSRAPPSVL